MPSDRRAAAHHESGHAVARLIHGLRFDRAYILADGTGAVEVGPGPRGHRWGGAIRALSGPVAEARYTGQPLGQILSDQAQVDYEHASAALEGTQHTLREAVEVAHQLVDWAWPGIEALAAVLEAEGEIAPGEAIRLINLAMA